MFNSIAASLNNFCGALVPRGRPTREAVYRQLDNHVDELWQRMGGLPNRLEAAGIWRGIWLEEAHHSTAIEGNTLVLRQVEALLDEGKAVGDKELGEYMEVRGYADAADWVYGQAVEPDAWSPDEQTTVTEVRHVHALAMAPVWSVSPHPEATPDGRPRAYRRHDIRPFPRGMTPPPWQEVPARMTDWIADAAANQGRGIDFPTRIARVHAEFERIHPFLDGNGRTGRLLLNLLLVRNGYPPAVIYRHQRAAYLEALRTADRGDPGALGEIIARAILNSLYRFIMPAVAGPSRLVRLAALAGNGTTVPALRAAAARGRLHATRGADGQWRSTRGWVDTYLATRYVREDPLPLADP